MKTRFVADDKDMADILEQNRPLICNVERIASKLEP
jgi:hypothetical protein